MFSKFDYLALAGSLLFLTGVYLWFGLPPALMLAGAGLIVIAVRLDMQLPPRAKEADNP